jgi:hypothetical protein
VAWYSIEVFDGGASASLWAEAHADAMTEAALTSGASDWTWERHSWGVAFEVLFEDDATWEAYCANPVVQRSLDAVPDPLTGLLVYKGRGGSSGAAKPRKPRPLAGSGAAALPLPWDLGLDELTSVWSIVAPVKPALAYARA